MLSMHNVLLEDKKPFYEEVRYDFGISDDTVGLPS
jgi:hypothetical protein